MTSSVIVPETQELSAVLYWRAETRRSRIARPSVFLGHSRMSHDVSHN